MSYQPYRRTPAVPSGVQFFGSLNGSDNIHESFNGFVYNSGLNLLKVGNINVSGLTIGNYSFPSGDGPSDTFLSTDGQGQLVFATPQQVDQFASGVDLDSSENLNITMNDGSVLSANLSRYLTSHPSILAALDSDNDSPVFIQDIFLDQYGHVSGINVAQDTIAVRTSGSYYNPDWLKSINSTILSGIISAENLPSYVDDVLEFSDFASFPSTGESSKIYVDLSDNKIYRWSGSTYVEVSPSAPETDPTVLQCIKDITCAQINQWNLSYDTLVEASGNWNTAYNTLVAKSGDYNQAFNVLVEKSGVWNSTADLVALSGDSWAIAYNTLVAESGNWNTSYDTLVARSGLWNTAYNVLVEKSGVWNRTADIVALSGDSWSVAYNTLVARSGNWNTAYNTLVAKSGDYNQAYDVLVAKSGVWNDTADLVALSGDSWAVAYNTLVARSGNWNTAYDTLVAKSGNWNESYDVLVAKSGNWNTAYDTLVSKSGVWNDTADLVALSGDAWAEAYSWGDHSTFSYIDGNGTVNYVPVFSDSNTLTNSVIQSQNYGVGINTSSLGPEIVVHAKSHPHNSSWILNEGTKDNGTIVYESREGGARLGAMYTYATAYSGGTLANVGSGGVTFTNITENVSVGPVNISKDLIFGASTSQYAKIDKDEFTVNNMGLIRDFRVKGNFDDQLLFVKASTDRVGIGTDSPDKLLHVDGISKLSNIQISDGNISAPNSDLQITAGGSQDSRNHISLTNTGGITLNGSTLVSATNKNIKLDLRDNGGSIILDGGNVGIGTSSPQTKLDVSGVITASGFVKYGGTSSQFLKADGSVDDTDYLSSHPNISNNGSSLNNPENTFIQNVTLDDNGHVTNLSVGVSTGGEDASGIASLLEDPSPQLGSGLDVNGYDINMGNSSINFNTNTITDTKVGQWDTSYNVLTARSGVWNSTAALVALSGDAWTTAYSWGDHSQGGYLTSIPESGNWNTAYNVLVARSGLWNTAYSTLVAKSGHWNTSYDTLVAKSGLWNSTADLVALSGDAWTTAYKWGDHSEQGYLTSIPESGNWNTAYDVLVAKSGAWNISYDTLVAKSGLWNSTADLVALSGDSWTVAYNTLVAKSGNYNQAYDVLVAKSGLWNSTADLVALSGDAWTTAYKWGDHSEQGYLTSIPESGNWNTAYNVLVAKSGNWNTSYDTLVAKSGLWNSTADLVSLSGDAWAAAYNWGNHAEENYLKQETLTSLSGDPSHSRLIYIDESGVSNNIDISWTLDDTNAARLASGVLNENNGIATFHRDDFTSFNVDFSALFDDTNLARITQVAFNSGNGLLTLSRGLDSTTISESLEGRYFLKSDYDSHDDVVVDGDFASEGLMKRGSTAGSYSIVTDNSANWNDSYNVLVAKSGIWNDTADLVALSGNSWTEAYSWGDHATEGYLVSIPESGNWNTSYNVLVARSGLWNTSYNVLVAKSGDWNNTASLVSTSGDAWTTAYKWGDHSQVGYLNPSSTPENYIPKFSGGDLAPSIINNVGSRVGIGESSPEAILHINGEYLSEGSHFMMEDTSSTLKTELYTGNTTSVIAVDDDQLLGTAHLALKVGGDTKATFSTSSTTFDQNITVNASSNEVRIGNTSTVFNESAANIDFRVESELTENAILIDANENHCQIHRGIGYGVNYASSDGWKKMSTISSVNGAIGYYGQGAVLSQNFVGVGGSTDHEIDYGTLPNGMRGLIWKTLNNTSDSSSDGGWRKSMRPLGNNKTYISVVYVKRVSDDSDTVSGRFYHGCGTASGGCTTLELDGTSNTNPYFHIYNPIGLPKDVWCISIGIIHANDDTNTTTTGAGGIYRLDTGEKLTSHYHTSAWVNKDFKMGAGDFQTQEHRTFLYYDSVGTTQLEYCWPGFYEATSDYVQDLVNNIQPSHPVINAASSTNNTGRTYIQNLLFDQYGHVSGVTTATETVVDTNTDTDTQLTDEQVQDIVGDMVSGNTESNITVTYDDAAGKLNFVATGGGGGGGGASNLVKDSIALTAPSGDFTVPSGYNIGSLDVYQNGIKLFPGSAYDYQATNGTTFSLTNTAASGDLIEYVALNATTNAVGDTSLGSISVTSDQDVFNTIDTFTSSNLAVFLNGVKLVDGNDYNVTSASQFTLTSLAVSGDIVEYIAYGATVASANLAKTGDTMTGNLTVNADLIVTGYKETYIDNGNSGTIKTIDISNSTVQTYTLSDHCTFNMPPVEAGRSFTMLLKTGSGGFTATFTNVKFPTNSQPSITTDANRMDLITFVCDGTSWYGNAVQEYHV